MSLGTMGLILLGAVFLAEVRRRSDAEPSPPVVGDIVLVPSRSSEPCVRSPASASLLSLRWIAYAPTNYDPTTSPPRLPGTDSIRADLAVLREAGFDGLVTYTSEFVALPEIAEQLGFRGILLGVWDPNAMHELALAKTAARRPIVRGIIVGNEGLMFRRYDLGALHAAMTTLRCATGKPVSTSETIEHFVTTKELVAWSDFLAPNAHPFHNGVRDPKLAVEWTVAAFEDLGRHAAGKPLLFKEVGLPTAGDAGLSEEAQARYYALLSRTTVRFVYFEAFDGTWKRWAPVEPHWGLFRSDRSRKPVLRDLWKRGRE